MTYEENIQKVSTLLLRAGKSECTVEYINKKIKSIMENEGMTTKSKAFAVFKSDRDIKRALSAGALEEVSFDVLSVSNGRTRDKDTPFQEVVIAINRNNKPEIRRALLFDREVPLTAQTAYRGKLNLGEDGRVDYPDGFAAQKLEKAQFDANALLQHSEPIEDAKEGTSGVWHGTVGAINIKNGSARIEVSSDGSLLPTVVWVNDTEMAKDVMKGDDVVFGGYNRKTKGVNAAFIMVAKETETNPLAGIVL